MVFATGYTAELSTKQGTAVALISCDVLGIPNDIADKINEYARRLGINNVVIAATHTHYAPAVIHMRMAGEVDRDYLKFFEDKIKESIENSINELSKATEITITKGETEGLCMNRIERKPIKNDVIMIKINDGRIKSAIINFNCHPITLGPYYRYISSDYPSRIYKYFNERGVEALFINGAAGGDINPNIGGEDGITTISEGIVSALNRGVTINSASPQLGGAYTKEITLTMRREHLLIMKHVYYELLSRVIRTPWTLA